MNAEKISDFSTSAPPFFRFDNQIFKEVIMQKVNLCSSTALIKFSLFLISVLSFFHVSTQAQTSQYRAFWVDTFNTTLNNHTDVVTVVNNAKAANANMILAQVRRRGDAWYLNSLEPAPDFTPIAAGFDPLADLITTAHAEGIEVHAFVIMGAVWNKNPNFAPTATLGPPTNPNHVFNLHGGYNPATQQIVPGPNNWLTRSLIPDGTGGITFQGHRFGSDFWLDFGHEDAAAYSVDVLMQLVNNYDIDGLHLDRIRYPEFSVTGQTPSTGTNIGYNPRSVERFQIKNNIPTNSPPPATNDAAWSQWRRDQVSNLVRRVYLNAIAAKPNLKVSAALIAFGGGPTTEAAWNSAEAYWRVYQDWRSWTQEGILDIAIVMNYKNENTAASQNLLNTWNEWTKNHQYNRATMIGLGSYLNSIEGNLRQTRRSLQPSALGNSVLGVSFYSMATTNIAVTANPFSIPAGQNTPARPIAEFASALKTGKSIDGNTFYEDTTANPVPIFSQTATIPTLQWKVAPTKGHLKGFARNIESNVKRGGATVLDTATVTITNLDDNATRTTATDGGGFYGGVDLTPGNYLVRAVLNSDTFYSCVSTVTAGNVTTADLSPETIAPVSSAATNPAAPNKEGVFTTPVEVTLSASDNCSGVASTEYSLDGASWQPYTGAFTISDKGTTTISYRSADRAQNTEGVKTLPITIDLAPTAANGEITGRVTNNSDLGLDSVTVSLSGGSLAQPIVVRTTLTGHFRFSGIPTGETYLITVKAKRHTFKPSSRVLTLNESVDDINFVSEDR